MATCLTFHGSLNTNARDHIYPCDWWIKSPLFTAAFYEEVFVLLLPMIISLGDNNRLKVLKKVVFMAQLPDHETYPELCLSSHLALWLEDCKHIPYDMQTVLLCLDFWSCCMPYYFPNPSVCSTNWNFAIVGPPSGDYSQWIITAVSLMLFLIFRRSSIVSRENNAMSKYFSQWKICEYMYGLTLPVIT